MTTHDTNALASAIAREVARRMPKLPTPLTWLSPTEAAEHLRLTPRALEGLRSRGQGPRFHKVGRLVRYRLSDIDAWLEGGGQ